LEAPLQELSDLASKVITEKLSPAFSLTGVAGSLSMPPLTVAEVSGCGGDNIPRQLSSPNPQARLSDCSSQTYLTSFACSVNPDNNESSEQKKCAGENELYAATSCANNEGEVNREE
jgi:hypothetical protein